jgi:zinc and cadmium transporter
MPILFWILLATILISFIAFIGMVVLFFREKLLKKVLLILVAFAGGSMMGAATLHLLPEAFMEADLQESHIFNIFYYFLLGFLIFFALEQFFLWHHHHTLYHPEIKPFSYLILLSDGIHNFIDGLIIAASFLVSLPLGITTSLAVALHEIPQEIGDFGILIQGGFRKIKALFLNFVSAISAILGGIAGFFWSEIVGNSILFLLPLAAGSFIYITLADLIPEISYRSKGKNQLLHFFVFLAGISLMILLKIIFH